MKLVQGTREHLDSYVAALRSGWSADDVRGCEHRFKYRLAYVIRGTCMVRYDNEAGQGDHRHVGRRERPYEFTSLDKLQADFWADVARVKE